MQIKRLWHTCMIALQRGGMRRAAYCRKHNLYHHIGNNCSFQTRKIPLYSELISIHDNVRIASRVNFITHDISYAMLNTNPNIEKHDYAEKIGCIEIMDNVFIGAGATIMYNVRIGSNTIIAAESVVTKDIEGNGVYGGCPARKIEDFDTYLEKLSNAGVKYPKELSPHKQVVSKKLEEYMWNEFEQSRSK